MTDGCCEDSMVSLRRDKVVMTGDNEVARPLSSGLNWGGQEHQNNIPTTISLFQLKQKGLAIDITMKKLRIRRGVGMIILGRRVTVGGLLPPESVVQG